MNFDEILDEMPDDIRELNWEDEGLVGQFKLGLKKVGVEITETEGNRNSCVLKKGGDEHWCFNIPIYSKKSSYRT